MHPGSLLYIFRLVFAAPVPSTSLYQHLPDVSMKGSPAQSSTEPKMSEEASSERLKIRALIGTPRPFPQDPFIAPGAAGAPVAQTERLFLTAEQIYGPVRGCIDLPSDDN